jgi:DNA-binding transcriptional LysR family regulator
MDLKRIRSFLAVAEHGGFRVAAEALGISQPALSAHIAELEAELKVPLVARTTRSVRLTPMGDRFLARARRALDELQTAALELRDEAALQRGRIVVACTPTLAAHRIPLVVGAFMKAFPAIAVEVLDDAAPVVERLVANGGADLGVAPLPERASSLGCSPIAKEKFVAVVPAGDPSAERPRVALQELAARPLIALPSGTSIRGIVEKAFANAGLAYEPLIEVRHHTSALGLVQAGVGSAILPESALSLLGLPKIRVLDLDPAVVRDLGILHRRGEVLSPAANAFIGILHQTFANAAAKAPHPRQPKGPAATSSI